MSTEKIEIKNVIEKVNKLDPKTYFDENYFKYIDLGSISQSKKCIERIALIKTNEAPSRARQLIRSNDVLVSTVRPNLNGVARISSEHDGAIASTGFCVLRPKADLLDSKYLFHWVCSYNFVRDMSHKATGASYPAVSDKIVKDSKIPLPPLDEQRRIAKILDKQNRQLLDSKNRDRLILDLYQTFFESKITSYSSNQKKTIADISVLITKGESPGWQGFKYQDKGITFITSENVRDGYLDINSPKYICKDFHKKLSRSKIKNGDILVNLVGASIGRSCTFSGNKEANINQAVAIIRLKDQKYKTFLQSFLMSVKGKRILLGSRVEGARANISLKDIRNIEVPIPTDSELNLLESMRKSMDSLLTKCSNFQVLNKELNLSLKRNFLT
ncbi:restriction endonuclease subunit S [Prochlorococcus sp. AH-736-M13]|nr:restriction endonuclease subunit S [Prochlorococcus sp. AH-736-M13]MDA9747086.1 restriction endonuclease subunit S [Prochlorococcus sp. AH-736-M13]